MRRHLDDFGFLLILAILAVTLVFLVLPIVVSVMMSFDGREYLGRFPPPDYSVHWYTRFFSDAYYLHGLNASVIIALLATVVSTTAGVSAAIVLDRYEFPGKAALEALFLPPLVVPAVVIGFALLLFFALLGVFDGFTRLLAGHIIITFPYTVRTTLAGHDMQGKRPYERNDGAGHRASGRCHPPCHRAGGRPAHHGHRAVPGPAPGAGRQVDRPRLPARGLHHRTRGLLSADRPAHPWID